MTDRNRILAELADRARRDLQLRYDHFDRQEAARTAAISDERKKQLNLTPEHFRKAWEFIEGRRVQERAQLEKGIAFFGTFSSDVLAALDDDLRNEGPLSNAHGISLRDGTPGRHTSRHSGTASFLSEFKSRHSGERYIRDFFTFLPTDPSIIHDAWAALGLEEPIGLTEVADEQYSKQAIGDMLLVTRALRSAQEAYQGQFVKSTGYGWGDEFAYRTEHLRHFTRAFAEYYLERVPADEALAYELGNTTEDRYGLTLEGVTEQNFLQILQRYRGSIGRMA